jgi:hypothetical protein
MNETVRIYLLSMVVPAIALAGFIFLERRRKDSPDEVLEPAKATVGRPKFKVITGRKR